MVCGETGDLIEKQGCSSTRNVLGNCGENYKGRVFRGFSKLKLNNGFPKIKIIYYGELVNKNLAATTSCLIDVDDK
jgi:hypothetical protein